MNLSNTKYLFISQKIDCPETFGFEGRALYRIYDDQGSSIAYAAEQGKGISDILSRSYMKHDRFLDVFFYDSDRNFQFKASKAVSLFSRFELETASGRPIGAIQKKFSIITQKLDIENSTGEVLFNVEASYKNWWNFTFYQNKKEIALVERDWSKKVTFADIVAHRDDFNVEFKDDSLGENDRKLIMTAAVFIDVLYFSR